MKTTPRLAPTGSPVELTYTLIGEVYGAMSRATSPLVRDGTISAYVHEHTENLAVWLDSPECVIPANLRALGSAAVTAAQAFADETALRITAVRTDTVVRVEATLDGRPVEIVRSASGTTVTGDLDVIVALDGEAVARILASAAD